MKRLDENFSFYNENMEIKVIWVNGLKLYV